MDDSITVVTALNLNKICRVCLLEFDTMYSLFCEIPQNELDIPTEPMYICKILMSISSIEVLTGDGLPLLICANCIEQAQTAYNFQQQCNRSQEILQTYVLQLQSSDYVELNDVKETDNNSVTDEVLQFINIDLLDTSEDLLGISDDINETVINEIQFIENDITGTEVVENTEPTNEEPAEPLIENHSSPKPNEGVKSKRSLKKSYECNNCGKKYRRIKSLKVHLRAHTLERQYVCRHCDKSFTNHSALKYHSRGHTGEQPFPCNICGKKYRQAGSLTAHMRVHTGQKPFLCSVCGRGFRQAPDLSYHMRTHTQERPYMCNVCGKTMRMQCHLVQHIRMHTGERPFKCDQCDKAFPSTTRLKRHVIIHTGLRPYACDVCDKSFNRISSLRVHAKTHTDERPYVCSVCGKAFKQANALKGHINTHLSSDPLDVNKPD